MSICTPNFSCNCTQGLDALGIATLDYFTSAVIPFAAPFSFSSLTEEDRINLTNLRRLLLLLSRVQSSKSASVVRVLLVQDHDVVHCDVFKQLVIIILQEVKEGSIYKNQTTYSEEASLVFYQLASAQEVLPILSVIPEVKLTQMYLCISLSIDPLIKFKLLYLIKIRGSSHQNCNRSFFTCLLIWPEGWYPVLRLGPLGGCSYEQAIHLPVCLPQLCSQDNFEVGLVTSRINLRCSVWIYLQVYYFFHSLITIL